MNKKSRQTDHIKHRLRNIEDTPRSDDKKEIIFSPRKNPVFPRNDNLTDVEKEIKSVDKNTTSSK